MVVVNTVVPVGNVTARIAPLVVSACAAVHAGLEDNMDLDEQARLDYCLSVQPVAAHEIYTDDEPIPADPAEEIEDKHWREIYSPGLTGE